MTTYSFKRLITKYSRPTTLHIKGQTSYVNGKAVTSPPTTETIPLAIIPFDTRDLVQLGGIVQVGDANLFSLTELKHGDQIEQNGKKYTVDTSADFTPFADFYRYIAKGMSNF